MGNLVKPSETTMAKVLAVTLLCVALAAYALAAPNDFNNDDQASDLAQEPVDEISGLQDEVDGLDLVEDRDDDGGMNEDEEDNGLEEEEEMRDDVDDGPFEFDEDE